MSKISNVVKAVAVIAIATVIGRSVGYFTGTRMAASSQTASSTTVSPANPYSLSNALACGFTIRARREMYGGFDRYLLAKEL